MSVVFTITGSSGTSVSFEHDEATDTGQLKPYMKTEIGSERTSSGKIKQQARPGKRYSKTYLMALPLTKYIDFNNLITDQSNFYYINYTTAPEILTNDASVLVTNDFEVALDPGEPEETVGDPTTIYKFRLEVVSVNLL